MKHLAMTLAVTGIISVTAPAFAQNIQPGVIDRPVKSVDIPEAYTLDQEPADPIQDTPPVMENVTNGEEVVATIRQIEFSGVTSINEDLLHVVTLPYLDRPLTKQDLAKLKYELTREFYDRGFTLVKAATPPQDLSDGVLHVHLVEATVGSVNTVKNDVISQRVVDGIVARYFDNGDVYDEERAESLVSDLEDLHNVRASLVLRPGSEFATTNIDVAVEEAEDNTHYIMLDNYGSELTGEYVAAAHFEHGNVLGLGEKYNLDARISDDELWGIGVSAIVPTTVYNTNLELGYAHTSNEINNQPADGDIDIYNIALSSNVLNTRNRRGTVRVGLEVKDSESTIATINQEDKVRHAYVEGNYIHRGFDTVWYASARVSQGVDILDASNKGGALVTRAQGDPEAVTFQPALYVNWRPFEYGQIRFNAAAQWASNALLSADLFAIGGYGTVRGFQVAQLTGESGYHATVEYLHDVPVSEDFTVGFGPWIDAGAVHNRVDAGVDRTTDLYSAGLGLEVATSIVPAGDTILRLDWAHPISDGINTSLLNDPDVHSDSFYFRIKQEFSLF